MRCVFEVIKRRGVDVDIAQATHNREGALKEHRVLARVSNGLTKKILSGCGQVHYWALPAKRSMSPAFQGPRPDATAMALHIHPRVTCHL